MTANDAHGNPRSYLGSAGLALVVLSQVSIQVGAATATSLFPVLGPIGTVSLRLLVSAILLLVILRPRLRGLTKEAWIGAALLGVTLTAMNNLIYVAFDRIPLGIAVTVEMLGPLLLAVFLARKVSAWLLAGVAFVGVWLLSTGGVGFGSTRLDPLGLICAGLAGVSWVGYILCSRHTAQRFRGADGLAAAMLFASVLAIPIGVVAIPDLSVLLSPWVLGVGVGVAALSSALPYALEQVSLRTVAAGVFSMLQSLSPAIAALIGFVLLGQRLTLSDLVGITLVTVAAALAMRQPPRHSPPAS